MSIWYVGAHLMRGTLYFWHPQTRASIKSFQSSHTFLQDFNVWMSRLKNTLWRKKSRFHEKRLFISSFIVLDCRRREAVTGCEETKQRRRSWIKKRESECNVWCNVVSEFTVQNPPSEAFCSVVTGEAGSLRGGCERGWQGGLTQCRGWRNGRDCRVWADYEHYPSKTNEIRHLKQ